jgi:hypothetical protein
LSTRGQLDRRAQRPPFVHLHSPGCPPFVPMPCARRRARTPGPRPPSDRTARKPRSAPESLATTRPQACDVRRPGPVSGRISPTCAHSWGQLLDVSTGSSIDDESLSRRNWASAVHGVAHNCGQRHVDVVPEAAGRPRRWCATGRAGRPRPPSDEAGPESPPGRCEGGRVGAGDGTGTIHAERGPGRRDDALSATGGGGRPRPLTLAGSGRASRRGRYCRARLLMRAVSSVTWV